MENYLGEIRIFSFSQIPRGWIPCSGQILSIAQNQALFSLLGVQFGGNGTTSFAVPNLNGRAMVGTGPSTSGSNYTIGQSAGSETVTLNATQLPTHTHLVNTNGSYDLGSPATNFLSNPNVQGTAPLANKANANLYAPAGGPVTTLAPCVTPVGNNQPHENRQPYLVMSYCIATQGIFPSRQ